MAHLHHEKTSFVECVRPTNLKTAPESTQSDGIEVCFARILSVPIEAYREPLTTHASQFVGFFIVCLIYFCETMGCLSYNAAIIEPGQEKTGLWGF